MRIGNIEITTRKDDIMIAIDTDADNLDFWTKEECAEFIDQITARFGWKVLNNNTFGVLQELIENELSNCTLDISTLDGQFISDFDASELSKNIINEMRRR